MTMTASQARQSFQQVLNMSAPQTRDKLMIVQNYLDHSDIDYSTTNGSKVFATMSKFAKGPLERLLDGSELSEDDHVKIQAAAYAGSQERLTKHTFYKGRDLAVAELNQQKLAQLRKESLVAGQNLPHGVRTHATMMYVEAQKNPAKIPDFLAFAEQMIDTDSPIHDQMRIDNEERAGNDWRMAKIIEESDLSDADKAKALDLHWAAVKDPSQQDALKNFMDDVTESQATQAKTSPALPSFLIQKGPAKIQLPGPGSKKTPMPASLASAIANMPERKGPLKNNFDTGQAGQPLPSSMNADGAGTETKNRFGFFSALVRPARVATAAVIAGAAMLFTATMLGNGQDDTPADMAVDVMTQAPSMPAFADPSLRIDQSVPPVGTHEIADVDQSPLVTTPSSLADVMAGAPSMPASADPFLRIDQSVLPVGTHEITDTEQSPLVTTASSLAFVNLVSAIYQAPTPMQPDLEALFSATIESAEGLLNSTPVSLDTETDPATFEIDPSSVSPTIPGFSADIDPNIVADTIGHTANIDPNAVAAFPPFQTASIDPLAVADFPTQAKGLDDAQLDLSEHKVETADISANSVDTDPASMDNFETGLSDLFNGQVPDALSVHANQIGNGLNTVDDAIFAYRTIAEMPNHAKGSAAHAFAMQNLEMIANGNFGPVSTLAQDAIDSNEWMAKRYNLDTEYQPTIQLAQVRPQPRPSRG